MFSHPLSTMIQARLGLNSIHLSWSDHWKNSPTERRCRPLLGQITHSVIAV